MNSLASRSDLLTIRRDLDHRSGFETFGSIMYEQAVTASPPSSSSSSPSSSTSSSSPYYIGNHMICSLEATTTATSQRENRAKNIRRSIQVPSLSINATCNLSCSAPASPFITNDNNQNNNSNNNNVNNTTINDDGSGNCSSSSSIVNRRRRIRNKSSNNAYDLKGSGWHPRSSSTATAAATTAATSLPHQNFASLGIGSGNNRANVESQCAIHESTSAAASSAGSSYMSAYRSSRIGLHDNSKQKMVEPITTSSTTTADSGVIGIKNMTPQRTTVGAADPRRQSSPPFIGTSNGESAIALPCSYEHRFKGRPALEIFSAEDLEKVEDWLDEHPAFVHNYFVRKASRSLIDSWLMAHSSSMSTLGKCSFPFDLASPTKPATARRFHRHSIAYSQAPTTQLNANQLTSNENSGANTPVRKISAHEFEASGGGFLRPMVSTTCDGTLTFLPIQDATEQKTTTTATANAMTPDVSGASDSDTGKPSMTPEIGATDKTTELGAIENATRSPTFALTHSYSTDTIQTTQYGASSPANAASARLRPMFGAIKSRQELLQATNDEKELIFELVKDICNDLDVRSLCHKILKNVSILTNADRCSLFLVRGEKNDANSRYLVSHLFDVSGQSTVEQVSQKEEIIIPWGTGIVGHVAESGTAVNIPDCYQDSRFTDIIDKRTGFNTRNMLCNPIFDFNGQVIGVAQVINKNGRSCFTENDEAVFAKYLQFCGIGIRNAQIYERSQLENRRNQVLLDLARMVFEKQSTIDNIIFRILIHIISLLQCQRAQILLLTDDITDADFYYYGRMYRDSNIVQTAPPISAATMQSFESWSSNSNVSCSPTNIATSTTGTTTTTTTTTATSTSESSPVPIIIGGGTRSFSRVFDLDAADLRQEGFETNRHTPYEGRFPINIGVTGYVATTGETLNIADAYADSRFDPIVDDHGSSNGFRHRHILCMPIRNATRKIIGVAQLVNKLNDRPFNKNDENLFEAFAIFSGMGIENTQMFEKAVKAMAKQKVTLELLSYHASASEHEAAKFAYDLQRMLIPSTNSLQLASFRFDDFCLGEDQMIRACIRMFVDLDLIERFHIDYKVLCKWILSVRKNYRPVLYHNWRHAFNVAQMMFAIFVNTNMCHVLGELETLAMIVACLCHDLDHRGTNNSFQIKTSSPLAQLYSTSTLEHHHFDQSLMILNSQGNQILSNLSPEEYRRVMSVLEEAILATDLAVYFRKRDSFFYLIDNENYDWSNEQHRSLLRSMLMTCCDIAAITKPWEIQKVVAELVASEFFQQGDIEKEQLNIEPIDMMNREKIDELPKMQMSFIDSICLPVYESFGKLFPQAMKPLLKGVWQNREAWTMRANEPYQLAIRNVHEISPSIIPSPSDSKSDTPSGDTENSQSLFSDETTNSLRPLQPNESS